MRFSGVTHAVRVGGLIVAITMSAAGCGKSDPSSSSSAPSPKASAPAPAATPTASLPPGCHGGLAENVQEAIAILTDPSNCPGSVNAFWKGQLGERWTEPVFIPYDDGEFPDNACGAAEGSTAGTVGVISRSEENQADCDAGVTSVYARNSGRLPLSDVFKAAKQLYEFGDTRNFGDEIADSPDAHGSPLQRAAAFARGYVQKLGACRTLGKSADGSVTGLDF